MKILYVQELGGGFGHVNRLAAIAQRLSGHDHVFEVPAESISLEAIHARVGEAAEIRIAPTWYSPDRKGRLRAGDATLADVFHDIGYADLPTVSAAAAKWQKRLAEIKPDLIIADFAPTLRLVNWGAIPLVALGNWYVIPPAGRELPPIRPWDTYLPPASKRREAEVLACANAVRKKIGGPPLLYFADLLHGDKTFVNAFGGFDAYRKYRSEPAVQPFNIADIRTGPPFSMRRGPAIFAYLTRDTHGLNPLLTAFNSMLTPTHLYLRGVDPQEVAKNCAPQVSVHVGAADLSLILPQVQLFVHYGGAASSYAGLLAGTPQFMACDFVERDINAFGVHALGCGHGARVANTADPQEMKAMLEAMLADRAMQGRALDVSRDLVAQRDPDPRRVVAEGCEELLRREGARKGT